MPIKFGSDGWRGIIGQDFTLDNVARIVMAICHWCPEISDHGCREIYVGYDNRELSRDAAIHACRVIKLLRPELQPYLADEPCPSPYISWVTNSLRCQIGIQITASHNPENYNGVKLKSQAGGSLLATDVQTIESLSNQFKLLPANLPDLSTSFQFDPEELQYENDMQLKYGGAREGDDPEDGEPIFIFDSTCGQKIVVDQMHGATNIYVRVLANVHRIERLLRNDPDPKFGGSKPEPLPHLLTGLRDAVLAAGDGTVGLAFDGDGDRLAVVDETGAFLQSHEIFALLLDFVARSGYPGRKIVTTVSFSSLLGRIASSYGLETIEVPVGFKHVSAAMLEGDVLIAGEESGGAAFGHYLPERDALLMALILLRAKGEAGVTLHEMLRDIYARFGRTEFVHVDVALDPEQASRIRERIPALLELQSIAGERIESRSDRDGVKLRTAEGWVLVRASGTEPLARFYAEAGSKERAEAYVRSVREIL